MAYLRSLSKECWRLALVLQLLLPGACISTGTPTNTKSTTPCQNVSCATTAAGTVPASIPATRPFIDTWNNVHLFQAFDYNISHPSSVADSYDFVWGAQADYISQYRSANKNIFLSFYMPLYRDWGTFPDSTTRRTLDYWRSTHPDWVLYKCDRITPVSDYDRYGVALDFTNPAVVTWQIQTYALPASMRGYDGLAVDNVTFQNYSGACGVYVNGQWVQHYTGQLDDPQWRADILNWLKQMQHTLHQLQHPLASIVNFYVGDPSLDDGQVQQLVNSVDGLLDEDGFTESGRGNLAGARWVQRVAFMASVQKQNKPYYVIDQFPSVDQTQIQWAIASYLMGKEHMAALFISTIQGYGADTQYDEYRVQIGSPRGPMYQKQGVYIRDYTQGMSIVNPSATATYTVTLDGYYRDLYGEALSSTVSVPPLTGMVLLQQP